MRSSFRRVSASRSASSCKCGARRPAWMMTGSRSGGSGWRVGAMSGGGPSETVQGRSACSRRNSLLEGGGGRDGGHGVQQDQAAAVVGRVHGEVGDGVRVDAGGIVEDEQGSRREAPVAVAGICWCVSCKVAALSARSSARARSAPSCVVLYHRIFRSADAAVARRVCSAAVRSRLGAAWTGMMVNGSSASVLRGDARPVWQSAQRAVADRQGSRDLVAAGDIEDPQFGGQCVKLCGDRLECAACLALRDNSTGYLDRKCRSRAKSFSPRAFCCESVFCARADEAAFVLQTRVDDVREPIPLTAASPEPPTQETTAIQLSQESTHPRPPQLRA